jgi:hypothetical protein
MLLAQALATRGFPERAEAEILRGLEVGERSDSPADRFNAWSMSAFGYARLRDARSASRSVERVRALDVEDRPPFQEALSRINGAWARAMQEESESAVAELRAAMDAYDALGSYASRGCYLGMLAEAELVAGHVTEGLVTIERALAAAPEERIFRPELLRLRGELRTACEAEPAAVESDLHEAIALAREMGAKLVELRATTSLARQLARRGASVEGRALLAPLYASFTEGFAARDLVEAKALLDELGDD